MGGTDPDRVARRCPQRRGQGVRLVAPSHHQILQNKQTGKREIEVQAAAKDTGDNAEVTAVAASLAKMANIDESDVTINDVGPSWGPTSPTRPSRR